LDVEDAMAWKKNSLDAVRRFDELVAVPGAERKIVFGWPVYQLGKERYAILHENRVVLRLSPEHAAQLIAKGGRTFEPIKGRPRRDRVVVPEAIAESARSLRVWIHRAVQRAQSVDKVSVR
jgi:hypothetical protein